jgi:hypothetical protein
VKRITPILILILLIALPAVPAAAQSATTTPRARSGAPAPTEAALGGRSGFGRGGFGRSSRPTFGRSRPSIGTRRPAARRPIRRRPLFGHGFFGSALRFLGIAYLANMLFGWGPGGGSPLGLLILLAGFAWLVTRRRARRATYRY